MYLRGIARPIGNFTLSPSRVPSRKCKAVSQNAGTILQTCQQWMKLLGEVSVLLHFKITVCELNPCLHFALFISFELPPAVKQYRHSSSVRVKIVITSYTQ